MEKINLSERYFELQKEVGNSEAAKIIRIKQNLEDSLFIFKKNYEELKEVIELYYSRKLEKWANENRKNYNDFFLEFQRYFHNFLASVFSLIEHSTVFKKDLNNKQLNDFYELALKELISNKCIAFIKDLRIYSQHYKLPLTTSSRGSTHLISPEGKLMAIAEKGKKMFLGRLALLKEELTKWGGWSKDSKEFISKYRLIIDSGPVTPKIIDVKDIIEIYFGLTEKFYSSFFKKINELYSSSFKQYQKLRYEMNDVIKLMENNPEFQDHNRMR